MLTKVQAQPEMQEWHISPSPLRSEEDRKLLQPGRKIEKHEDNICKTRRT